MLKYISGDVTNPIVHSDNEIVLIPHVCNNMRRFGAGVSGAIGRKWPEAEKAYRTSPISTQLGEIVAKHVETQIYVVHMIAQHDTQNSVRMLHNVDKNTGIEKEIPPVRYGALAKAMIQTQIFAGYLTNGDRTVTIASPMFGAGLSGGDWNVIESMILELWVDKGLDVTVYRLARS